MPRTIPPVVSPGTMADATQPAIAVDPELALRPWLPADVPVVIAAFRNPEIQHWHGYRVDDLAEARRWVQESHSSWRDERTANWAIVDETAGDVLGRVALHTNLPRGFCEIAYWVLPVARGRDVATRAAVAATDWAHQLGLHRVELQHSTHNAASCRVATKAGFTAEGTHRGKDAHVDGWHDMHQHSHLSTDL